jgi:uncharacterized damage-inducible protein DinB
MLAMITAEFVRTMAAYNAEMNRRVYGAASRLPDAKRREDRGAFWGSIHGTLSHLVWADQMWMSRFDGWDKPDVPNPQSGTYVADFDEMQTRRFEMDRRLQEWADRLDLAWLLEEQSWYSGAAGRDMRSPRSILVTHLFNHQTHHRGQAHALVTAAGEKTGDTDIWLVI